ncbi:MAG: ATP-grasp domain-containing protein, partial [Desulfobacteraceae bacterium]|nr:ATP-grasp domain-containing protein [Desulfobacteraceae bacterium]
LCAGRKPVTDDLSAMLAADAIILPQGCHESLYTMARSNCKHVFPNFDAKFKYKGKIGQIQLFQKTNTAYPRTETYLNMNAFSIHYGGSPKKPIFDFPFVFKFDWGGDGDHVYLVQSAENFSKVLQIAKKYEHSGQKGFIIQEYIPANKRSLRVVVIGQTIVSYWRVQRNTDHFLSNVAKGAMIDYDTEPDLQKTAIKSVKNFCSQTRINLAGFDILFSSQAKVKTPLFLEINYFFGRQGLGGSEKFYDLLIKEIMKWIESLGLSLNQ